MERKEKGKGWVGTERKGKENWNERKGKEREGNGRKGKGRKGREGKRRKKVRQTKVVEPSMHNIRGASQRIWNSGICEWMDSWTQNIDIEVSSEKGDKPRAETIRIQVDHRLHRWLLLETDFPGTSLLTGLSTQWWSQQWRQWRRSAVYTAPSADPLAWDLRQIILTPPALLLDKPPFSLLGEGRGCRGNLQCPTQSAVPDPQCPELLAQSTVLMAPPGQPGPWLRTAFQKSPAAS